MQIKVIETGKIEQLTYRAWDGYKFGPDQAMDLLKTYIQIPFDRSQQAYILTNKEFRFWKQYIKHLEADETKLRDCYQNYKASDVEMALKKELAKIGDDPALHHRARREAIKFIEAMYSKKTRNRMSVYDEFLSIRFSVVSDAELVEVIRAADEAHKTKCSEIKRLMRLGLKYEQDQAKALQDDVDLLKQKGWL